MTRIADLLTAFDKALIDNGDGTWSMRTSVTGGGTISGDVTITGNLTVQGNFNFGDASVDTLTANGPVIIDVTLAEAFLVRKDGDTGDVLAIDTVDSQVKLANGTALLPAYTFASDPNTGFFRKGADNIGFAVGGAEVGDFSATNLTLGVRAMFSAGQAVTAGNYSIGRNNASTNVMFYNVPTGTSHDFGVNGTREFSVTAAGAIVPMGNNLRVFNTADETTNTEAMYFDWSGNVARVYTFPSGTGAGRVLQFSALNASAGGGSIQISSVAPFVRFLHSTTSIAGSLAGYDATSTASSGTTNFFYITPIINQSGTAASNVLIINPTLTAVGSGIVNFVSMQTSSIERFGVRTTGDINHAPIARTTAVSPVGYTYTGAAHTGLSNAIYRDFYINNNRSVQFAGGGASIQYAAGFEVSPISFAAASAQSFSIIAASMFTGSAISGTNVTATIQAVRYAVFGLGKSANLVTDGISMPGIDDGITSMTSIHGYGVSGFSNVSLGNQTATLDRLSSFHNDAITYESATNVRTVTEAAGAIFNAPVAGTNVSFTAVYGALVKTGHLAVAAGRLLTPQGADVASAADVTLGNGNYFDVTGTTNVQRMLGTGWTVGSEVTLQFDASVTVEHNVAAGSGYFGFQLAGAANFSATAGDTLTVIFDGAFWREKGRAVI